MPSDNQMPPPAQCPLNRWSRRWLSETIRQGIQIFLAAMADTVPR